MALADLSGCGHYDLLDQYASREKNQGAAPPVQRAARLDQPAGAIGGPRPGRRSAGSSDWTQISLINRGLTQSGVTSDESC